MNQTNRTMLNSVRKTHHMEETQTSGLNVSVISGFESGKHKMINGYQTLKDKY